MSRIRLTRRGEGRATRGRAHCSGRVAASTTHTRPACTGGGLQDFLARSTAAAEAGREAAAVLVLRAPGGGWVCRACSAGCSHDDALSLLSLKKKKTRPPSPSLPSSFLTPGDFQSSSPTNASSASSSSSSSGGRRRRPRRLSSSSSFYLQCHSSGRKCIQLFEKGECTYAAAAATKLLPTSFPPSLPSFPSLPFPRPSCGCECVCFCTLLSSLHSAAAAALSCCATTTYPYTTALARPLCKTSPSIPPFKSNFISVFHKV